MSSSPAETLRGWNADVAIILGSGLDEIVSSPRESISYTEFGELPPPTIAGHSGKFSLAEISERRVIFARGRSHLYEGHSARDVTAGVRLLAQAGVRELIVTNAAGALNPEFQAGDWMLITDHLNLTGATPLEGAHFLDLTNAYSNSLTAKFRAGARSHDLALREGVYAALRGPQYETPAEVRMLQRLGADAVGMSTVLEIIQARALDLTVAGFSCITNLAAGLAGSPLSHEDVLAVGKKAAANFSALLARALA